jgi:hypothetical protein
LANPDPQKRSQALVQAISQVTWGDSAEGQWLEAVANQGLLVLSNQLDQLQTLASVTLGTLNGGVIKNIQGFINQRLDLTSIQNVVTQDDFNKVDEWLIARLADFLDQKLDLPALKQIQTALQIVMNNAANIYQKAIQALNNNYTLSFAATYQRTETSTALVDVNFDLTRPEAGVMLRDVVANSRLDDLLVKEVPGVTLNQAALTHETKRTGEVQVHMPFLDARVTHVNDSLASLTVEHDSGRVLAYQVGATDIVTSTNRYMSQFSVLGKIKVVEAHIQLDTLAESSVAYQSIQVKADMTLAEIESRLTPFVKSMLANVFTDGASLDRFYLALDQTISNITGNRNNDFGDVALNFQVALPASVLAAWFQPLGPAGSKNASMMVSRALQAQLKALIPFYFFQNLNSLQQNATAAALLVWSALPVSTSIAFEDGEIRQFNTDQNVFWDWPDPNLRKAAALDRHTTQSLVPALLRAHDRWLNAGNGHNAAFFTADQAERFQQMTITGMGDNLLQSLRSTEAEMVSGAASALKDIQASVTSLATAPTRAISKLAAFGADLSATFNKKLSVYSTPEVLRSLNSLLLVEASRALDANMAAVTPTAMLSLLVLANGHTFQLSEYLKGKLPPRSEVALAQTLTNAGAAGP